MVYIVTINYTKFKFTDSTTAISFATLAKENAISSEDIVEVVVEKGEKDES